MRAGTSTSHVTAEQGRMEARGKLVRVRYLDHAIFLNTPSKSIKPTVRESIGWLVEEGPEHLVMVSDRRLEPSTRNDTRDRCSGIVLLKKLILKLEEVEP